MAFIVPLICYCFVLYFGLRGYRPEESQVLATNPG
jgi:fucose permease